jgi:probable HAF family extracellular repeat protein
MFISVAAAQTAKIDAIGWFNPNWAESDATDISADGSIVVGSARYGAGDRHAFRWSAVDGLQDLGTLNSSPNSSYANAISADGRVIAGQSYSSWAGDWRAFNKVSVGQLRDLDSLIVSSVYTNALGISGDGAVIVGQREVSTFRYRACRWTSVGYMSLGSIGGADSTSSATDVSVDGEVVVGSSGTPLAETHAFRWTPQLGMYDLRTIENAPGNSGASAVSSDGRFVVGHSQNLSSYYHAFLWSEAGGGMKDLSTIGNIAGNSFANCLSDDGNIVGGSSWTTAPGGQACIWIDGKPRSLWDLLKELGADLSNWTKFDSIDACTPDGLTLAGSGTYFNADTAFRVTLPDIRKPVADAGKDIVVTANGAKGIRVRLDGGESYDPDGGKLTYAWASPGIKFKDRRVRRPLALFPVGTKRVRLTVTDNEGDTDRDTVNVTVKLPKNSSARIKGADANDAFAYASGWAASGEANADTAAGYQSLLDANRVGLTLGDLVRWEEGGSLEAATVDYALLRSEQLRYGTEASAALLRAYGETGDEATLYAAYFALAGAGYAEADLSE